VRSSEPNIAEYNYGLMSGGMQDDLAFVWHSLVSLSALYIRQLCV